jgi:hypothetical protein
MSVQQQQASPAEVAGVGLVFAAAGLYFILVGLNYLPMPGPTASPPFVVVFAGAAFLFAGMTALVRAKAGAVDQASDLPPDAPRWTQVSYRAAAIGCVGSLALIGTWVAIGAGPRAFNISGFVEMRTTGEAIGRSVFALGSVIAWIYVIALAVSTVRKFFTPRG